jgi:5-formyltetrahydrofolate cyclo-ligase
MITTTSGQDSSLGSSDDNNIRRKKQELRKRIRNSIKELTQQEVQQQSMRVWQRVFDLPVYQSANSVGLFLSMPHGEINTDALLEDCVLRGKSIYVPEVGKNFEYCDMQLRKVVHDSDNVDPLFHKRWPTNKWNIPEPPPDMPLIVAKPGDLDLLIMPGLGFDRFRNRLGQGKGYYDRFLARMNVPSSSASPSKPLPLVAVALTTQLVVDTSIPMAEYDHPMDLIVLPDEVIGSLSQ